MGARWRRSCLVFGVLCLASGALAGDARISLRISLEKEAYVRGVNKPVDGLEVTVSVSNDQGAGAVRLPRPVGGCLPTVDFNVELVSATAGEAGKAKEAERVGCTALRVPPEGYSVPKDLVLNAGESKEFAIDIGGMYDVRLPGKYKLTCHFVGATSNSVEFVLLPLRAMDVHGVELVSRLREYEGGMPGFPYMFYVCPGTGRYDEIVYLVRRGTEKKGLFGSEVLCSIPPGDVPEMLVATSGKTVGLLVRGKAGRGKWFYVVDMTGSQTRVRRVMVRADSDMPYLDDDGNPTIAGM